SAAPLHAAEPAFADTWKARILLPDSDIDLFLVKVKEQEGKPQGVVLSAGLARFKEARVEATGAERGGLQVTIGAGGITFAFTAYPPKGETNPKKLLGSVAFQGQRQFAVLERSDLKELDPQKAVVPNPAFNDFAKAMQKGDKAALGEV